MSLLESRNPLNQEVIGHVSITSNTELHEKVSLGKAAQRSWAGKTLKERAEVVTGAYAKLSPYLEQLSQLISLEMGKDARRAGFEVRGVLHNAEYFINSALDAFRPESLGGRSQIQYQPLGVVAVISPWNYPLAMANNLIIPSLVAGNSVILKPSEHTPLVADLFVKALQESLPENLVQIVHGDGEVGRALVKAEINMVAFTGSLEAGRNIMAGAALDLKRLVMELGGNDPMIVMRNADLRAAARFAVASSFENAGQMCTSTERVYVDASIAKAFEDEVVAVASQYQTGPWNQPGVNIGPIANPHQHQKIVDQLIDAEANGAKFLLGHARQKAPYIEATVVSNLSKEMRLENEETFGPVVAIAEFDSIDEAVKRANDSVFGLGAVVFGGANAREVAERLEAGMVSVNQGVGGMGDSPWVGAKQSGFGFHGSKAGNRQFTQVRVVSY
ncbi:MAG: aldehyde dehydrogenase family protein [Saccharospirillaceae bacterium]|nr:succinate-semialdehyde dehydrogenase [Thalassolituus sp. HI0120]MCH2039469.1 aldehyde dehydrogenase family protein [Saccharospirillaceae bacterium]